MTLTGEWWVKRTDDRREAGTTWCGTHVWLCVNTHVVLSTV